MQSTKNVVEEEHTDPSLSTDDSAAGGDDLISRLSDDVIVSILGLVGDAREVVRMGVLSRRWRGLWTRVPVLHLDSGGRVSVTQQHRTVHRRCQWRRGAARATGARHGAAGDLAQSALRARRAASCCDDRRGRRGMDSVRGAARIDVFRLYSLCDSKEVAR
jgi:hypothetical protein